MLKRYIAFSFAVWEGFHGGWRDVMNDGNNAEGDLLVCSFDTLEEAFPAIAGIIRRDGISVEEEIQIVDLHTGQVVVTYDSNRKQFLDISGQPLEINLFNFTG